MNRLQWRLTLTPRKALDAAYLTAISVMSTIIVFLYHANVGKDAECSKRIVPLEQKIEVMAVQHAQELIDVKEKANKEVMEFKDKTITELQARGAQQEQSKRNMLKVLDNNEQIINKQSKILNDLKNARK